MQETPESTLWEAQRLVSSLGDKTMEELCSERRASRVQAIDRILRKLNSYKDGTKDNLLQSLPIALIQSHEYIGTVYFVEECIWNGAYFDPKVIDAIIGALAAKRVECIHDDDSEAVNVITKILHGFYNTILSNPEYQKNPEIYLSIGTNVEQEKDTWTAIDLYNEAMWLGSMDGYFFAASAYETLWNYDMSANIFDAAYQLSWELRFLHRYIHALCKAGKREEAYTYYLYLQKQSKETINPFIVYVGAIESDDDLHDFDLLMTAYHGESTFEPSESLRDLTSHASVYISNEIERESLVIERLNLVPIELWTDEQDVIYRESIKRRFSLMQTHIITLQDQRYLDFYLDETRRYTIEWNARTQNIMNEHFANSFSSYVFASYQQISWDKGSQIEDMELFESMRLHLVQIAATFSQHSFYETLRDKINPFIDECMKIEWIADNDDLESPDENELILKKNRQEYDTFSESTKKLYEDFVAFIEKKYGIFYRRSIQLLVRDEDAVPVILKKEYEEEMEKNWWNHAWARNTVISNMKVFLEYPDIALLFLLEKIMLWQDILSEEETIGWLVEKYHLDFLIELDALLLSWILYESGEYEYAIEYMMNVPWLLDVPQVLFMIAEWIRYMDDEQEVHNIMEALDTICREEYEAESFFDHISNVSQDIFGSEDPRDEEIAYMLMAHANMQVIRKWNSQEIVAEFQVAGEYGCSQWYISAGDIHAELWNYDKAIELFHKAYLLSPNIVSLRRLLDTLLVSGRFDTAWEYIEMEIRDNYDISGYMSAWYLYQWKNKEAMEELCKIIQSNGMIDLILPEWYMELLAPSIQKILNSSDSSVEQEVLKIHASYINASLSSGNEDSDPEDYIHHIAYIWCLIDEYKFEDVIGALLKTIPFFTGKIDFDDGVSDMDKALGYLHLHLTKIHNTLERYHKKNQKNQDLVATQKTFNLINALNISAIVLFQRFPESEKYLKEWRNAINMLPTIHDANHTIHKMPEIVQ